MLLTLPMEIRCNNLSTLWQRPPLRQKDVDTIQTSTGTISRHFFSRWRPSFGKKSKPSSFLDIWILSKPFIDDFCLKIVSCSCFLTYVDLEIFIWQLDVLDVLVLEHWNGPNDGIPLNPSLTSDSSSPLIMWPGICHPRMKPQKTFIYHEELNRSSQSRINFTPDLLVFNLFYTIFSPRTIKAVTFPQIAEIKSDSILQFISPQTWLSEPKSIKETCSIISCLLGYLLNWGMLASSSHSCLN